MVYIMKQALHYSSRLFFLLLVTTPLIVFAEPPDATLVKSVLINVLVLSNNLIFILINLAFIVLGWGIIKLISAGGDTKKVSDAKGILTWGIIGIFVLASMYGIIFFIKQYIGIPNNPVIQVPKFQ